jgi:hypothetical protein
VSLSRQMSLVALSGTLQSACPVNSSCGSNDSSRMSYAHRVFWWVTVAGPMTVPFVPWPISNHRAFQPSSPRCPYSSLYPPTC